MSKAHESTTTVTWEHRVLLLTYAGSSVCMASLGIPIWSGFDSTGRSAVDQMARRILICDTRERGVMGAGPCSHEALHVGGFFLRVEGDVYATR